MGQHVWLLVATIGTELLAIAKWSTGQFPEPLPARVKAAWAIGAALLVLYPTVRVSARFARWRVGIVRLTRTGLRAAADSLACPASDGICAGSRGRPRRNSTAAAHP